MNNMVPFSESLTVFSKAYMIIHTYWDISDHMLLNDYIHFAKLLV